MALNRFQQQDTRSAARALRSTDAAAAVVSTVGSWGSAARLSPLTRVMVGGTSRSRLTGRTAGGRGSARAGPPRGPSASGLWRRRRHCLASRRALAEIWGAEDRDHARRGAAAFKLAYGAKFGKAVAKITDDLDQLLAFYDYPAEHWIHLRTTNPIESTFATVRNRSKITKGPGSKAAGIAMAFKLIEAAQARWRAVNGAHLVALVRAGSKFTNGKLIELTSTSGRATQAEAA